MFDAAATLDSPIITSATAAFTSDLVGTKITLRAAGLGGLPLVSTVVSIQSSTQITISNNASVTVTLKELNYNLVDETAGFQSAIDFLIANSGGKLIFPTYRVLIDGTVYVNPTSQIPITIQGSAISNLQDGFARASNGSCILRTNPGDIIRVNLDATGKGVMVYPSQYTGFAIDGITFVSKSDVAGINAIKEFRVRGAHKNLNASKIDYVIIQPEFDATTPTANQTFCDQSSFENITVSYSMLGGIKLTLSDASIINRFYYEVPTATAKYGIEIDKTRSAIISAVLHGVGSNSISTDGSAIIKINGCFSTIIDGIFAEDLHLESLININNSGATSVRGIFVQFTNNNTFTLRFVQGLSVDSWYSYETKNAGTYDVKMLSDATTNFDIVINNFESFNTSGFPGAVRKALTTNNKAWWGPLTRVVQKETTSDLNDIYGYKWFTSTASPTNGVAGASFMVGFQTITNSDENFRNQFAFADGVPYTRKQSNGVWANWIRSLTNDDLTTLNTNIATRIPLELVTDWNAPVGYKFLRGTAAATNGPTAGAFYQGYQVSGNNDSGYINQVVWNNAGSSFTRSKVNGVWSAWVKTLDARYKTLVKNVTYTILTTDFDNNNSLILLADATTGNIVITLPAAASILGLGVTVIKTDASVNTVTVKGNGSELINNANTFILREVYQKVKLETSGTQFFTDKQLTDKGGSLTISANRTLLLSDYGLNGSLTVYADATTAAFTVTLLPAATDLGYTTKIVKTDVSANTITVKGSGSELINNANTDTTLSTQNTSFILESNGTKHFKF